MRDAGFQLSDLATGHCLLSRIPSPANPDRVAASAWCWPLIGAFLNTVAGGVGWAALWLGLPPAIAAGVLLATLVVLTGALHEDGLADTADGFWGGHDAERRLEIMKDSRLGSYGALALILSIGLRWTAISQLMASDLLFWPALIAVGALSRAPMVSLMRRLPAARATGMSANTGRPPALAGATALLVAAALAFLCLGRAAPLTCLLAVGVAVAMSRLALSKIGGQTGDVLGACQQMTEVALLLFLTSFTQ